MNFRRLAGGAERVVRPHWALVHAIGLMLAIVAGLWGGAEARIAVRAIDHHAIVLNGRIAGSAFLIGEGLALTNAHVVEGLGVGGAVTLAAHGRRSRGVAYVLGVSQSMDLALLRAPQGFLPVVSGQDAPLRAGVAVLGAGVDASGGRALGPNMELPGSVIAPRKDLGAYGPGLVVRMPGVRPGFSGGPVLDAQGRLVGMLTAIRASDATPAMQAASGRSATRRAPDEAFVLRAREIREEARRLLQASGRGAGRPH